MLLRRNDMMKFLGKVIDRINNENRSHQNASNSTAILKKHYNLIANINETVKQHVA